MSSASSMDFMEKVKREALRFRYVDFYQIDPGNHPSIYRLRDVPRCLLVGGSLS